MDENEIILVDTVPKEEYLRIAKQSVQYAILSVPFTVNRMKLTLEERIVNIAKGKMAEELFFFFATQNAIPINTEPCKTPFYRTDRRDFILNGIEWDIKNNFLKHNGTIFKGDYISLPALIPDRFPGDQWSKRNKLLTSNARGVAFLFTYMKLLTSSANDKTSFLQIHLTQSQKDLIRRAMQKYKGQLQSSKPFDEDAFWKRMKTLGNGKMFQFKMNEFPALVIGGYAGTSEFKAFKRYAPQSFLNGVLATRIHNRGLALKHLPSFVSLFPGLKKSMRYARFK